MTSQLKRNLLSLAGLGIFVWLALGSYVGTNKNENNSNSSKPNTGVTAHGAGMTTYSNSRGNFTGNLKENYVDFSFEYPSDWKKDPGAGKGDSPNFVKIEQATDDQITLENFAVGYYTGQREFMPKVANQLSEQFSGGFPEYKKVSEGETKVGRYDGYEFRFTAHAKNTPKGDLDVWGRVVILPGGDNRKGAALIMLATSASDQVRSVDDVGEKGELPKILSSFKFDKD
jgi:hypothetical protein